MVNIDQSCFKLLSFYWKMELLLKECKTSWSSPNAIASCHQVPLSIIVDNWAHPSPTFFFFSLFNVKKKKIEIGKFEEEDKREGEGNEVRKGRKEKRMEKKKIRVLEECVR